MKPVPPLDPQAEDPWTYFGSFSRAEVDGAAAVLREGGLAYEIHEEKEKKGGSHFSHLFLALGVLGSVLVAAKAGEAKARFWLLAFTIPATIYACLLGFLFIGAAI